MFRKANVGLWEEVDQRQAAAELLLARGYHFYF